MDELPGRAGDRAQMADRGSEICRAVAHRLGCATSLPLDLIVESLSSLIERRRSSIGNR